jgi:hypothetical protein
MWTNETLKTIMDVIERGTYLLRRTNKSWNIPLNLFFDHLKDKTRSKKIGPKGVFIEKKDDVVII